jgi:hypothetical protein
MTTYTDTQIADELAAWLERDRAGAMPVAGVTDDDDENADLYDLVECLIAQRAPVQDSADGDPDRTTDIAGDRL